MTTMLIPLLWGSLGALAGPNTASPFVPTLSTAPLSTSAPLLVDLFVDASAVCASGNGTAANPYCTIGEAVATAVSGDVIRIAGGTYLENISLGANVALIGLDGQAVTTIDGGQNGTVVTVLASADVTMEGLTITGGSESGIVNEGGLVLTNSTVTGNTVTANDGGGGIYHDGASGALSLRNVTLTANNGGGGNYGGAIYGSGGGPITLESCTVSGNSGGYGGGVYSFGTDLTIIDTTIDNNFADYGAGLGGGQGAITVVNSTISGNTGGGLLFYGSGPVTLRSTTVFGNTGGYGGFVNYGFTPATLTGTVIAGSTNMYGNQDVANDFTSGGFNFIGNGDSGTGLISGVNGDQVGTATAPLDPMLGSLADNGGTTLTHQPLAGSPLINAGDQTNFEPTDQRGALRMSGSVDIGSTEEGGLGTPGCVSNPNSTGTIGTIAMSGSTAVADDNFTLTMANLPTNQFGIFLVSPTPGFQPNTGGSAGNLCLGGTIGRFFRPSQILGSGAAGAISLQIPLTMLPQGNGFIAAQPGDIFFFQGWHRDIVGGTASSNFSPAIGVAFN